MDRRAWRSLSREVIANQGEQCLLCGSSSNLTCHHVVARRDGGPDSRKNLIGLCATDHTTLHLIERDVPLRSRLLIAIMVIFGPSPDVCRFLRFLFPVLIRRDIGFHPAGLRLRWPAAEAPIAAEPEAA
ncbi:MAG: HNH endonuclease signature motif containing protein [Bryobacteraceae bacterium]